MQYAELQVTSNFSFLRGASHPDELVEQAAAFGYNAIAITDRNTVAGIVRGHVAAKKIGIQFLPACRIDLVNGPGLLVYPVDKSGWEQTCALLTKGNLRTEKGKCELYKQDVYTQLRNVKLIVVPPNRLNAKFDFDDSFKEDVNEYRDAFGKNVYIAATKTYNGDDQKRLYRLSRLGLPMVATNNVYFHEAVRRQLQDVLTCVREKCTIHDAGFRLYQNAERYLKSMEEMHRLFRQYPDAIENALVVADACKFSLDELQYVYPEEITTAGRTPQQELIHLTWKGANERFNDAIPTAIKEQIDFELNFIERKNYAAYFLTVHDLVRYARSKDILCQGRGSAANSVVCYCLGITSVDPSRFKVLFARFMSDARNEPPDIDVDFEHERREDVIQYIYEKYGRDRAGIVATVTQERYKGAIRDVGKAMGLSVDIINRLSGSVWSHHEDDINREQVVRNGLNPDYKQLAKILELTKQLIGFPRQLGQHTGGFVITQNKLSDLCPILNARMENRTCIEWNKDDIEALGFLKIDVLALGMLTCIRKGFDLLKEHYDEDWTLANVPQDIPEVYEMISRADTIGVFQIESRAQMSMLPRLKPNKFYDLVIEVAIVRPGPIQGDMVHPYLRRRNGEEEIEYPSDELKEILGRTLGVPLFQEQAMQIAIDAGGFTPDEADQLRRSMATFKAKGKVSAFHKKLIDGMTAKGYKEDFAERVFKQLEGFGSYGFPESHAASFALLAYVSSWMKWKYPEVFAAALLNSQPMGFYQPAQIVIDARKHDVEVRPIDVNHSAWDNKLETSDGKYRALRLGFRNISGMREEDVQALISARIRPFAVVHELINAGVSQQTIEKLADADAFRSMNLERRTAWWEVAALQDKPTGIYTGQPTESAHEPNAPLPMMTASEHVIEDYAATGLSLKAHPVSFVRDKLHALRVTPSKNLNDLVDGALVKVAGLILVRQRPGTASGIVFITLEDEFGVANLVVFSKLFDQYRSEVLQSRLLMVEGKLQKEGQVIHIVAQRCHNLTGLLSSLSSQESYPSVAMSRSDERTESVSDPRNKNQSDAERDVFYKGRNFR